jgi:outer membrane protein W
MSAALRSLSALLLVAASASALAASPDTSSLGLYFRAGGLSIVPTGAGEPVALSNVTPTAQLSGTRDGPIDGSSTRLGSAFMPAVIVGYAPPILNRQLSIETVLGPPLKQKLYARGTLANKSLAPTALGSLPTGVPALGSELGEVTSLPPVLTAVYRFFPGGRIRPYLGVGGCLVVVLDTRITNPVLSSQGRPRVSTPPGLGWVVQAGTEVRFGDSFFLTTDIKYIGGLTLTSTVKDIRVALPSQPLYGSTKLGDSVTRTRVDPIASFVGVGMDF